MNKYVIINKSDIEYVDFSKVIGKKEHLQYYPDETCVIEFTDEVPFEGIEYEGPFTADEIIPILENRFPYEVD
jgi:hypothetical protein